MLSINRFFYNIFNQVRNLYHNSNLYDKKDKFIGDISFLNEAVRGALYRQMGFGHPMQGFMDMIVKTEKDDREILTRVDLDLIDKMNKSRTKDDGNGDDIS